MIRLATKRDIDSVIRLLLQVHKIHSAIRPDIFISGSKKYTAEQLEQIFANALTPVFVYEDNNNIMGYAFCIIQEVKNNNSLKDNKTLYIDDLCVDADKRNKGIGKQLYDYVLNYAKNIGCYNLTLNVWEGNDNAKRFYLNLGLKPQKTTLEKIL